MKLRPMSGRIGAAVVLACAGAVACAIPEPPPRHHRVEIRGAAFRPAVLEASPGDTVTWINRDVVPHTVQADGGGWDSGALPPGAAFTLVVEEGGAGGYACLYHPAMTATLAAP